MYDFTMTISMMLKWILKYAYIHLDCMYKVLNTIFVYSWQLQSIFKIPISVGLHLIQKTGAFQYKT